MSLYKFAEEVVELAAGFDRFVGTLSESGFEKEAAAYLQECSGLTHEGELMIKKAALMRKIIEDLS